MRIYIYIITAINILHDFQSTSTASQLDPAPLPRLPLSKSNPFGLAAKAAEAACTSVYYVNLVIYSLCMVPRTNKWCRRQLFWAKILGQNENTQLQARCWVDFVPDSGGFCSNLFEICTSSLVVGLELRLFWVHWNWPWLDSDILEAGCIKLKQKQDLQNLQK